MVTKGEIDSFVVIFLIASLGLGFGGFSLYKVISFKIILKVLSLDILILSKKKSDREQGVEAEPEITLIKKDEITEKQAESLIKVSQKIRDGADVFLQQEFIYIFMFILMFAIVIGLGCEPVQGVFYTTVAFLVGACTSVLCGFIGMKVATEANYRTTYETSKGIGAGFRIAYYGGCVLGFTLVSLSIIVLTLLIIIFQGIS